MADNHKVASGFLGNVIAIFTNNAPASKQSFLLLAGISAFFVVFAALLIAFAPGALVLMGGGVFFAVAIPITISAVATSGLTIRQLASHDLPNAWQKPDDFKKLAEDERAKKENKEEDKGKEKYDPTKGVTENLFKNLHNNNDIVLSEDIANIKDAKDQPPSKKETPHTPGVP